MTDLELLEQIDSVIDQYNQLWAAGLKKLYDKHSKIVDTPKWEKLLNKLNNKYAPVFADLLLERKEVVKRLSDAGEEIFMSQFEPKKQPDIEQEIEQEQAIKAEAKKDAARVAQIVEQAKRRNVKEDTD